MPESSLKYSIIVAVVSSLLGAALTLIGALALQSREAEWSEKDQFSKEAVQTFHETISIVDEGYLALKKLQGAADARGWDEVSLGPWTEYMDFNRGWNQRLIAHYFKVERYFGTAMARQLIELQIDTDANSGPYPEGKKLYNFRALADDVEASIRFAAVERSIVDSGELGEASTDWIGAIESHRRRQADTSLMLLEYKKGSMRFARSLNDTLTQLGVKQVTVHPTQVQR